MATLFADEATAITQLSAIWQQIRQHLEAEKQRVSEEIWDYPPPIPACDAQYNGLLEARSTLLHEIGRISSIQKQSPPVDEQLDLLTEIARLSPFLHGEIAAKIQQQIAELHATVPTVHEV